MSSEDQLRASALLELLERTPGGRAFKASCEFGRRYRAAQTFYPHYEVRAIDWCFATNLDRRCPAWRAVESWWPDDATERPSNILVLEGGKGTGKTTAANGLLLRRGGEFQRAGSLHDIPLGEKGEPHLARLRNAPLLVLDNLGSEKDIGPTLARIHALILHRDGQQLPTIITTTLVRDHRDRHGRAIPGVPPERSFTGRYEDDVADRVAGSGRWEVLRGQSMRGQCEPDLVRARRSARRWDALEDVVAVKRGTGDPRAVAAVARAAGITEVQLEAESSKMRREMKDALAQMPAELMAFDAFARYADRWGDAPTDP